MQSREEVAVIDPLDLLAFIESGMSMTRAQIDARWPEWSRMSVEAIARYERETNERRIKTGWTGAGTHDPMVNSHAAAQHHWVHLPLIRSALSQHRG